MTFPSHQRYQFTEEQRRDGAESRGGDRRYWIDAGRNPSIETSFPSGSEPRPAAGKTAGGRIVSMQQEDDTRARPLSGDREAVLFEISSAGDSFCPAPSVCTKPTRAFTKCG